MSLTAIFISDSDVVRAAIFATAATLAVGMWVYFRRAEAEAARFVEWLHEHRRQLLAGRPLMAS